MRGGLEDLFCAMPTEDGREAKESKDVVTLVQISEPAHSSNKCAGDSSTLMLPPWRGHRMELQRATVFSSSKQWESREQSGDLEFSVPDHFLNASSPFLTLVRKPTVLLMAITKPRMNSVKHSLSKQCENCKISTGGWYD